MKAPVTLYAIWARNPNVRTVTVKNALNTEINVNVILTIDGAPAADYTLYEDADDSTNNTVTGNNGQARFSLSKGESKNLTVPNGAKLVISADNGTAYSADFTDADSDEHRYPYAAL